MIDWSSILGKSSHHLPSQSMVRSRFKPVLLWFNDIDKSLNCGPDHSRTSLNQTLAGPNRGPVQVQTRFIMVQNRTLATLLQVALALAENGDSEFAISSIRLQIYIATSVRDIR